MTVLPGATHNAATVVTATGPLALRGTGSAACLCSVAHGAGRKLDRGKAVALMRHRYKRAELRRSAWLVQGQAHFDRVG